MQVRLDEGKYKANVVVPVTNMADKAQEIVLDFIVNGGDKGITGAFVKEKFAPKEQRNIEFRVLRVDQTRRRRPKHHKLLAQKRKRLQERADIRVQFLARRLPGLSRRRARRREIRFRFQHVSRTARPYRRRKNGLGLAAVSALVPASRVRIGDNQNTGLKSTPRGAFFFSANFSFREFAETMSFSCTQQEKDEKKCASVPLERFKL